MFLDKSLVIIPTKDRCYHIKKTLIRLIKSKIKPKNIIVIDSSIKKNYLKNKELYLKIKNNYLNSSPSISIQRNLGLKFAKKNKHFNYIIFLDDDIKISKNSFLEMNKALNKYKKYNNKAYSFNQVHNFKDNFFEKIKKSKISKILDLYHDKKGKILKSGFQTKINNVRKDTQTEWISFAAAVCRYEDIIKYKFDETFSNYSYLEDLDFSILLKKKFMVISKATYFHEKIIERTSFNFGFVEIINRHKIVTKHKLNKFSFYKMIILKTFLNLIFSFGKNISFFKRFSGNIIGLTYIIFFR